MMIISAKKLTRIYTMGETGIVGIRDIDLIVEAGELVVLKGRSGSGKSTLLSLVAGLDIPTSGHLQVAGRDLSKASSSQLTLFRREVVGMVFQNFNLLPTLNVIENVSLPGLLAGHSNDNIRLKAEELMEWLGLSDRMTHLPDQLSGGEMQRTAIARALINDPSLVLADEPTGNLDTKNGQAVIELLVHLNRSRNCTVVIATHGDLADACATRQIELQDGTLVNHP
jgi:putative ABC transport system ATP-binding protein